MGALRWAQSEGISDLGVVYTTDMGINFLTWDKVPYGEVQVVSPLIRRVTANNPGPYTYTGTGTYIVGHGEVAIIDPGPDDKDHVAALLRAVAGERVTHILVTHTHTDHSPATVALATATGATVYAYGPHPDEPEEPVPFEDEPDSDGTEPKESGDLTFVPDIELRHGDVVEGPDWTIDVIFTPGHIANHLCFALQEEQALFSGDHVMGWSTTVVPPPHGDLRHYMRSLELLLQRDDLRYFPTHGPSIENPIQFTATLLEHRKFRERQIVDHLRSGVDAIADMVAAMYPDLDEQLHKAAGASVMAHLTALIDDEMVTMTGSGKASRYRLR